MKKLIFVMVLALGAMLCACGNKTAKCCEGECTCDSTEVVVDSVVPVDSVVVDSIVAE